jgi:hypothetical protein
MSSEIVQKDGKQLCVTDKDGDRFYISEKSTSRSDFLQVQVQQNWPAPPVRWSAVYIDKDDARTLRDFLNEMLGETNFAMCRICGHPVTRVSECKFPECESERFHYHCSYENSHGICTMVGCWPE